MVRSVFEAQVLSSENGFAHVYAKDSTGSWHIYMVHTCQPRLPLSQPAQSAIGTGGVSSPLWFVSSLFLAPQTHPTSSHRPKMWRKEGRLSRTDGVEGRNLDVLVGI